MSAGDCHIEPRGIKFTRIHQRPHLRVLRLNQWIESAQEQQETQGNRQPRYDAEGKENGNLSLLGHLVLCLTGCRVRMILKELLGSVNRTVGIRAHTFRFRTDLDTEIVSSRKPLSPSVEQRIRLVANRIVLDGSADSAVSIQIDGGQAIMRRIGDSDEVRGLIVGGTVSKESGIHLVADLGFWSRSAFLMTTMIDAPLTAATDADIAWSVGMPTAPPVAPPVAQQVAQQVPEIGSVTRAAKPAPRTSQSVQANWRQESARDVLVPVGNDAAVADIGESIEAEEIPLWVMTSCAAMTAGAVVFLVITFFFVGSSNPSALKSSPDAPVSAGPAESVLQSSRLLRTTSVARGYLP